MTTVRQRVTPEEISDSGIRKEFRHRSCGASCFGGNVAKAAIRTLRDFALTLKAMTDLSEERL
jgi:hypothetical protein